ncbi:MAG: TolC family protein [Candidatus Schekmanbacteria bacterium]|nr:TolC family protein [Candidatus Schekmanbacteria bacterium]
MALSMLAPIAFAQAPEVIMAPSAPAQAAPAIAESGGELALDLRTAYALALSRNLDLELLRYDLADTEEEVRGAGGIFDPALLASTAARRAQTAVPKQLPSSLGYRTDGASASVSLEQLLSSGASVSLGTSLARTDTDLTGVTTNPRWDSDLTLAVRQPLLDGFGPRVTTASIVLASQARERATWGFRRSAMLVVQGVDNAFWDLVGTRQVITVKESSLALAGKLLADTEERVKLDELPAVELAQAKATVAAREQDLITARNAAGDQEDVLRQIIGVVADAEWAVPVRTTEPLEASALTPELPEAIATALESRPEMQQQKLAITSAELAYEVAENALRPSLDASASLGFVGAAGDVALADAETGEQRVSSGGADDAVEQVVSADYPEWSVGLSLAIPLGNRNARAALAQRRNAVQRLGAGQTALRQSITREVRSAVRGLIDGIASVNAAVTATALAQTNLEAEQAKLGAGLSTSYQVLKVQEDLATAQLAELRARIAYRKALTAYAVSTGTLLEDRQIRIAP